MNAVLSLFQDVDNSRVIVVYMAVLIGVIGRTIVPFLVVKAQHPELPFDKKYYVPALISIVLNVLAAPAWFSNVGADTSPVVAYLIGWGATDFARDLIKLAATQIPALEKLS
jgi:hypothetical protein